MKEKKVFEVPEVTTYDRAELDLPVARTGFDAPSDYTPDSES
jgi:hypothetical protein